MEKFKGTPGPWYINHYYNWIESENADKVVIGGSQGYRPDDAQLIAAAPELLDACMRMRNQLYAAGYEAERGSLNPTKCLLNQIESAINKALGE